MRRIYLDSNILIAHFAADKAEEPKKKLVQKALTVLAESKDVEVYTSMWAVTEMVNILVSHKKMERGLVAELENQLVNERRLGELKLSACDVSPQPDYDFAEFFFRVRQGILKYHSGVGDVIHSVIMKNNRISEILTFDEKGDFKEIQISRLFILSPKLIPSFLRLVECSSAQNAIDKEISSCRSHRNPHRHRQTSSPSF